MRTKGARSSALVGLPLAAVFAIACGESADSPAAATESQGDGDGDGDGDSGDGDGDGDLECEDVDVAAAVMRRLTRLEYDNTVKSLLGVQQTPAAEFVAEEEMYGFDNNSSVATVGDLLAEQYMLAAEELSEAANLELLVTCDPQAVPEEVCAESFVRNWGERAYRRPLDEDQVQRLMAVWEYGRANEDFDDGIRMVIAAALQSPHFLYRVELGSPADVGEPGLVALDDWEIASRLSFLLWNSMPDEELFDLARAGMLHDRQQVRAQAERMLDDPRARSSILDFHEQLFDVDEVDQATKDPTTYPEFDDEILARMREESSRFFEHVFFEDDARWATLMTATYSFLDAELAHYYDIYDVDFPEGAGQIQRVGLPASSRRAGILTHGALLTVLGKFNDTAPVHRGLFVRDRLLCQPMPPPPDVEFDPPTVDPNATTQEKYEQHSTDPSCRTCHELMDPIGFGFEHFDGAGQFRATSHGFPVDASGDLLSAGDVSGEFYGVPELAAKLAVSRDVQNCVSTQWFRYGYGRGATVRDRCSMNELQATMVETDGDLREVVLTLTQLDAFYYARPEEMD